jgi:23S rRNA (pseudouridine1915-N3)-methyltransferase
MIKIICVGKVKEKYLRDMIADYIKRISKYHKIEIIELIDSNINKEKEELLKVINTKDYNIVMDIDGNNLSSIEFAEKIDKTFLINSNITFIIGGSDGVSQEIKKLANYRLSFSRLTFPHQLFRGILLEQIYRAFKILNNESYHK